ncbi:MAG TPA: hypothetical protein VHX68_19815 [Planctomycetaceae bacterium]|nr:hypothetical protein [Planctomycetaceae bacterium]
MTPRLTEEQRQAVDAHEGCVEVEDSLGQCVLMSIEVFRDVMGVGTDREFQESVAALRRSYEQVQEGRTRPVKDALDDLGKRNGLSR